MAKEGTMDGIVIASAQRRAAEGRAQAERDGKLAANLSESIEAPSTSSRLDGREIAFHRLGRFRDRGLENQQMRASALNLVTAAIILFNCRYLGQAVAELQRRGIGPDPALLSQLSPLGWDRINLTGDYVWSDRIEVDANGLAPLRLGGRT